MPLCLQGEKREVACSSIMFLQIYQSAWHYDPNNCNLKLYASTSITTTESRYFTSPLIPLIFTSLHISFSKVTTMFLQFLSHVIIQA
jgi:hypothetical protein